MTVHFTDRDLNDIFALTNFLVKSIEDLIKIKKRKENLFLKFIVYLDITNLHHQRFSLDSP